MNLLLNHAEYDRLYNCSNVDIAGIEARNRGKFVAEAWVTIGLCTVYTLLYLPCLYSIVKHIELNACYKLLLYIGIADVVNIWLLGYFHGWFSLSGFVYCSSPALMYWTGLGVTAFWMAESSADLTRHLPTNPSDADCAIIGTRPIRLQISGLQMSVLALNRCLDMVWHDMAERLFKGWRVWVWLSGCTAYAVYWFLLQKPAIFSAIYFAWFFDPFMGIREDANGEFVVHLHTYHELVVGIASPIIYMIFCIAVKIKYRPTFNVTDAEQTIFLQVFIISAMNTVACILYAILERMNPAQWVVTMGQFAWFHIHGFPPVIYLALNKTMREDCRILFAKIFMPSRVGHINGMTVLKGANHVTPSAMNTTKILGETKAVVVQNPPIPNNNVTA